MKISGQTVYRGNNVVTNKVANEGSNEAAI